MSNQIPDAQTVRNETTSGANTAERVGAVLENLATDSVVFDTISDLKTMEASAGQLAYVRNHSTSGDGGGGFFELVDTATRPDVVYSSGTFEYQNGTTYNLPQPNDMDVNLYDGDVLRFEGGVRFEVPSFWQAGTAKSGLLCVTTGQRGTGDAWVEPNIEGVRIIPNNANVNANHLYWQRIGAENGQAMKLEWLGYNPAPKIGDASNGSCHTMFNELASHGHDIELDKGCYYFSSPLLMDEDGVSVKGKGGIVRGGLGFASVHRTNVDQRRTNLWTDQNIDCLTQQASWITIKNIHIDFSQVSGHNQAAIRQDLSFYCQNLKVENVSCIGDSSVLTTTDMGTNFFHADNTNIVNNVYLGGDFIDIFIFYGNYGFRVDDLSGASTFDGGITSEAYIQQFKRPYHIEGGNTAYINGSFIQDNTVLNFEEKDLPLIYLRTDAVITVPSGDHATGTDPASTEGDSEFTYPREHVIENLYDFGSSQVKMYNRAGRFANGSFQSDEGFIVIHDTNGNWFKLETPTATGSATWVTP